MNQNPIHLELETPKQLAERVGIPVSNVYYLIKAGKLRHMFTSPGKRNPKIPSGAWEQCVKESVID